MIPYVQWKEIYSVGEPSIDEQHKQILSMICELHDATEADRSFEVIKEIMEKILLYTQTHFDREEQIMRDCGYPDYENHKILHDKMRRRTEGLLGNMNLMTGSDLMRFLKEWWLNHIRGEDQCYVPYINAKKRQSAAAPTQPVGPVNGAGQTAVY